MLGLACYVYLVPPTLVICDSVVVAHENVFLFNYCVCDFTWGNLKTEEVWLRELLVNIVDILILDNSRGCISWCTQAV